MNPIHQPSAEEEPEWDSFGIRATDFRPHWDGDLVNVYSTIRPKPNMKETMEFAITCARDLAKWVISDRERFHPEDRFQIIIGWPKDIRGTGRQIIKAGGTFAQLESIASGCAEITMHGNWSATVFNSTNSEQGRRANALPRAAHD